MVKIFVILSYSLFVLLVEEKLVIFVIYPTNYRIISLQKVSFIKMIVGHDQYKYSLNIIEFE